MVKYVLKRIALMFFVFFTILTVCFVLVKLLPLVDAKQFGKDMNLIQQRREALGYNKPILIQYLIFLKRSVLGGDWESVRRCTAARMYGRYSLPNFRQP